MDFLSLMFSTMSIGIITGIRAKKMRVLWEIHLIIFFLLHLMGFVYCYVVQCYCLVAAGATDDDDISMSASTQLMCV